MPLLFFINFEPLYNSRQTFLNNSLKVVTFTLLILLAIFSVLFSNHLLLYLYPILMGLLILSPFLLSVRTGYIPLITQFYYLTDCEDGEIDPKRVEYTKLLTWLWIILICLILFETILLSFFAPLEIWSLFTNFINYLIILIFMLLEFSIRIIYFKQWLSPIVFVKQLILIDHRQLIKKNIS